MWTNTQLFSLLNIALFLFFKLEETFFFQRLFLHNFNYIYLFIYFLLSILCVYKGVLWRPEDSLQKSVLSFHVWDLWVKLRSSEFGSRTFTTEPFNWPYEGTVIQRKWIYTLSFIKWLGFSFNSIIFKLLFFSLQQAEINNPVDPFTRYSTKVAPSLGEEVFSKYVGWRIANTLSKLFFPSLDARTLPSKKSAETDLQRKYVVKTQQPTKQRVLHFVAK